MPRPATEDRKAFEEFTNSTMVRGARVKLMDDYAWEIFDLWFSGKAPDEVI